MLYFAYGSNMHTERMRLRCPSAEAMGPAALRGYRLAVRLFADIDPHPVGAVHGVLWSMETCDLAALDRYEGYPRLYERIVTTVEVHAQGRTMQVPAVVYIMTPATKTERDRQPCTDGYWTICHEGAREHGVRSSPFWGRDENPD
jgi:gamma-glutamylcyclotransferase (GGCT)/AIG2-like uncharacterized protein YtfP